MTSILIRDTQGRFEILKRRPGENGGRDWSDIATRQRIPVANGS